MPKKAEPDPRITVAGMTFEVRSPTFREFKGMVGGIQVLMDVAPENMFDDTTTHERLGGRTIVDFLEHVVKTLADGPTKELFDDASFGDVIAVWDKIVEWGRFDSFFASKDEERYARRMLALEREVAEQVAQIRILQREGLLREEFDMQSLVEMATRNSGSNPAGIASLSISTPESTGGPNETSSIPTTTS